MYRLTIILALFAALGLHAQPVPNRLENLPIVYVNAAPIDENGEPEAFELPMLPGSACDVCYTITRSGKHFDVVRDPLEGCEAFIFKPAKSYRGNGLDYVHFTSTSGAGCERNELYVVFFWNPNYYKGVVEDPEIQGVCGIPGLKMSCSGGPSPACNLVCNPGFSAYDFFAPNTLNAGVAPGWKAAQGQPAQTCQNTLGVNPGVLNLWRTNDEIGEVAYTNLRPGPQTPRLYLLTYTRAFIGGNTTLRAFQTVITEGIEPESVFNIGDDPRLKNGQILFSDDFIHSDGVVRRVAVLTTLASAPKQLALIPRQGRPYQNLSTRITVDQVELTPFPIVDSSRVATVPCDTVVTLKAPSVCLNSGSRWEWYNGNALVGLGSTYQAPPLQTTDRYRVCLNPQADIQQGGQLCYPFKYNVTGVCTDVCKDFRAAIQAGGSQIGVDTSGLVAVRFLPPASIGPNDRVEWNFGCDNTVDYVTTGTTPLALATVPAGNTVCLTIFRNVGTTLCQARLTSSFSVPVKSAVCACSALPAEAVKSFTITLNGHQNVTFTPRGQLNRDCDRVRWDFGDYSAPTYSRGTESVSYTYPLPKGYQACMTIVRTDPTTGKKCPSAKWCRSVWPMDANGGAGDRSAAASPVGFALSPNPTTGTVGVSLPQHSARLIVTDLLGRIVAEQINLTEGGTTLDSSAWSAGIYVVTLSDATGQILKAEKLVKM